MALDKRRKKADTPAVALGGAIKEAREARKLTQVELATAAGIIDQPAVSYWERGLREPQLAEIAALENALELPQGGLLLAAGLIETRGVEQAIAADRDLDAIHRELLAESYRFYVRRIRRRKHGK